MKKVLMSVAVGAAFIMAAGSASAQTLNQVKSRGVLQCGSNTGLAGFGQPDAQGNWTGLDVDYCRAMAAAIFNDPTKVKFVPLSAKDRFTALQSGEVDVLVRNTTWTMSRDTQLGLEFGPSTIMTARASWSARSSRSPRRWNCRALRSAPSRARPPS